MDRIEAMTLLSEIKHYLTAGNPVWDVDEIAEACDMAIEALRNEINCVNCEHYTERETPTGIKGVCKMDTAHREDLISRQALCEYALNQKDKAVTPNDIMRFPSADRKQVTGKLNNRDDSLLTGDTETCKEQKSKLDLISRQDAIEAIAKRIYHIEDGNENDALRKAICDIDALPSVNAIPYDSTVTLNSPTIIKATSTDLISRQDAFRTYQVKVCHDVACSECRAIESDGTCRIEAWLKDIPSADAVEVVRCKDCKHYLNEHICMYFSRHGTIETSSYAYCSYGERREP